MLIVRNWNDEAAALRRAFKPPASHVIVTCLLHLANEPIAIVHRARRCQCAASHAVVVRRRPSRLSRSFRESHDSHVFAASRQRLEPRWPSASDIERRVITAPAYRRAVHRGGGPSFACLLHTVRDWLQQGGCLSSSSKVSSRRTTVLRRRKLVS